MFDEAPKAIKIGGHTIYKESYNQRDVLESSVSSGRTTSTGGNGRSALIQIYNENKNMTKLKKLHQPRRKLNVKEMLPSSGRVSLIHSSSTISIRIPWLSSAISNLYL